MAGGMKVQIQVKCNHLPACTAWMSAAVDTAFKTLGPQLLTQMQGRTPVDTGALKNSETQTSGGKQLTLTAGTDHCGFVEFGTRYMSAQPYMGPTMQGAAGQVGPAISGACSATIGSVSC
jgi:HK97 gp10 family phage protein